MKKLFTLTKTLLVAAGLCVGMSAWAVEITKANVGNNTNWETDYLGDKSQAFAINSNGSWTYNFINYNSGSAEGYNNFLLECNNGTNDEFVLRADKFEVVRWSNANITSTYTGSNLAQDLNGASVSMTVTRNGYHIAVSATITPTTEVAAFIYTYDFFTASGNLNLYLSVDHSYLTISSAEWAAAEGTITETQVVNCDFENSETLFTNQSSTTISNVNNATMSSNVVSFAYSGNTFGSSNYIYSIYDGFSSSINTQVNRMKVEFDCYVTSGSPNYDILFSLCDKSLRNGKNRSQSDDGVIFNIGERRGKIGGVNTDYFSINNAVTSTTLNDGLNKWIHVEVNVDLENKKVSYIIRNQDKSTVLFKGYDVDFIDTRATTCDMIDYHAVLKIASYMDNLVITKYVDSSKINYTLKAIDDSSRELATLSSGWINSGSTVYYNKYVDVNGKYYVTASAPYRKVITSPDNTVVYSQSLVTQYVEATSSNWASTSYTDGADYFSGGIAYRGTTSAKTLLTVAEDGIYSVIFAVCSQNTGTGKDITLSVYKNSEADGNKLHEDFSINHSYKYIESTGLITIENLSLTEGDRILLKANKTSCVLDYIALAKTGVSATLGTNGYATFSSAYPLALGSMTASEGDVTAYYASTIGESSVTLTSIAANVEAGEGLILKGTAGATITIPVAASGLAISNYLVGCPTATELTTPNSNYYVMVNNGAGVEFQSLIGSYTDNKVTIPAGKAYLNVAAAGSRLNIIFDDDNTTSISTIANSQELTANSYYDLQGRRVAQPTKGLYIVNGKKVVVK